MLRIPVWLCVPGMLLLVFAAAGAGPASAPAEPKKAPLPPAADVQKAEKLITERNSADLARMSPSDRRALAIKLLQAAGQAPDDLPAYNGAVFNFNDGFKYTSPTDSFPPNQFGLYDMGGNVSQWCSDYYAPYADGDAIDPTRPATGNEHGCRCCRGGSWLDPPHACRLAYRGWQTPDICGGRIGFRVALDADGAAPAPVAKPPNTLFKTLR